VVVLIQGIFIQICDLVNPTSNMKLMSRISKLYIPEYLTIFGRQMNKSNRIQGK
jgi:vacuolar-type H+-ATPase catalytic subunit A/Vma1